MQRAIRVFEEGDLGEMKKLFVFIELATRSRAAHVLSLLGVLACASSGRADVPVGMPTSMKEEIQRLWSTPTVVTSIPGMTENDGYVLLTLPEADMIKK